MPYIELRA